MSLLMHKYQFGQQKVTKQTKKVICKDSIVRPLSSNVVEFLLQRWRHRSVVAGHGRHGGHGRYGGFEKKVLSHRPSPDLGPFFIFFILDFYFQPQQPYKLLASCNNRQRLQRSATLRALVTSSSSSSLQFIICKLFVFPFAFSLSF